MRATSTRTFVAVRELDDYSGELFSGPLAIIRTHRFRIAREIAVANGSRNKVLVDFGCADGYALPGFARISRQVVAVEPNRRYREAAQRRWGHIANVEFVDPGEFDYQGDILIALEVFEHINDIPQIVDLLRRFLVRRDQMVIASVPLETGLTRYAKWLYGRVVLGREALHYDGGYDYRPLLNVLRNTPGLALESVRFEPFGTLGPFLNRGVFFTIRARTP